MTDNQLIADLSTLTPMMQQYLKIKMQIIQTLVEKIEIIEITLIKTIAIIEKIHLTEIIEKMTAEAEKEETTSIIETIQKTEMAMKT